MNFDASQRHCAAIMRSHAKSFYFSTRILPRAKREAVEALYALFRTADDFADEPQFSAQERRDGLRALKHDLSRIREAAYASDAAWFPAARRAFARFPIGLDDALALVEGCESDLDGRTVRTFADLYAYSAAVAGTVGRTSMPILGASDDDSLQRGERLGIAMQYTNVLRDVDEDRRMGRNYLPIDDMPGAPLDTVMREVAQRARDYYREAAVLAQRVPNDGSRAALLMTGDIYGGILDRIEERGFDPTRGRAYVGTAEKVVRAARCVVRAYAGFATIK